MISALPNATITVPVTQIQPALFTQDGSGQGQGAILNQDGTDNSSTQPAARGTVVSLFGSGFGPWSEPEPDGTIFGTTPPMLQSAVSAAIGGVPAAVHYAGGATGLVAGVVQINVEIPAQIQPGDRSVVIVVGGRSSAANMCGSLIMSGLKKGMVVRVVESCPG
jgi:uncharacterized protein (TIGR03437 family)